MSAPADSHKKSPLEAAQKIVSELAGMTSEHQFLAVKFAVETLGIQLPGLLSGHSAPTATPSHQAPTANDEPTDIRSFTASKAPKSDRQFAAVVAYFYQYEAKPSDRKDWIDQDVMKEAARLAGWPQVTRWRMTLTNSKNAGYLDSAGTGKYKLSSVGENLVAITLPGDGSTAGIKNSGSRKIKKKTSKKGVKKNKR